MPEEITMEAQPDRPADVETISLGGFTYYLTFADILPPLDADEFARLQADIAENGIKVPLSICMRRDRHYDVLDGANRLKIAVALGLKRSEIPFQTEPSDLTYEQREQLAGNLNRNRRQLTREKLQVWALKLRAAGKSYRWIAEYLDTSKSTVQRVVEAAGVPNGTGATITGRDGKEYPAEQITQTKTAKDLDALIEHLSKLGAPLWIKGLDAVMGWDQLRTARAIMLGEAEGRLVRSFSSGNNAPLIGVVKPVEEPEPEVKPEEPDGDDEADTAETVSDLMRRVTDLLFPHEDGLIYELIRDGLLIKPTDPAVQTLRAALDTLFGQQTICKVEGNRITLTRKGEREAAAPPDDLDQWMQEQTAWKDDHAAAAPSPSQLESTAPETPAAPPAEAEHDEPPVFQAIPGTGTPAQPPDTTAMRDAIVQVIQDSHAQTLLYYGEILKMVAQGEPQARVLLFRQAFEELVTKGVLKEGRIGGKHGYHFAEAVDKWMAAATGAAADDARESQEVEPPAPPTPSNPLAFEGRLFAALRVIREANELAAPDWATVPAERRERLVRLLTQTQDAAADLLAHLEAIWPPEEAEATPSEESESVSAGA